MCSSGAATGTVQVVKLKVGIALYWGQVKHHNTMVVKRTAAHRFDQG